jgi:WD40 repeat protein
VHQLNQRECIKVLQGQFGQMYGIVFSPDGRLLATGGEGGGIQFWDMQTYRCVRQLQTPRIYEGIMISEAIGLTTEQRTTLLTLGAFNQSET